MVIGLLLGKMAEAELIRSYQISGGEVSFLLQRPIALVLLVLLLVSIFLPIIKDYRQKRAALTA